MKRHETTVRIHEAWAFSGPTQKAHFVENAEDCARLYGGYPSDYVHLFVGTPAVMVPLMRAGGPGDPGDEQDVVRAKQCISGDAWEEEPDEPCSGCGEPLESDQWCCRVCRAVCCDHCGFGGLCQRCDGTENGVMHFSAKDGTL